MKIELDQDDLEKIIDEWVASKLLREGRSAQMHLNYDTESGRVDASGFVLKEGEEF